MGRFTYALICVGMALYWPMLRRNALFYSLAGHDATPLEAVGWYSVFLLFVACAVALCLWRKPAVTRRLLIVLGAVFSLQAMCKVVEMAAHPQGALATFFAWTSVACFAVVLVALTYLWASTCVAQGGRTAALLAVGSFAASFLVKEFWTIPGLGGLVCMAAAPLISLGLWWLSHRACTAGNAHTDAPVSPVVPAPFPRALVAILAVFLVAGGVVRGFVYGSPNGASVVTSVPQDLLTLLFAGILLGMLALRGKRAERLQAAWSLGALLVFAGLLLMLALPGEGRQLGGALVVVGRTCLGLLFWIILVDLVRSGAYSLLGTFGVVFLMVEVLSSFLGYVVVPELLNMFDSATTNVVTLTLTAIAFALIAATMVFFNRTRLEEAPLPMAASQPLVEPAVPGEAGGVTPDVFAARGLTEREAEVAVLLAAGHSQRKISEVLSVSIGTVQSHIKAIYRKFDIHSRQEFIDALQQEQA